MATQTADGIPFSIAHSQQGLRLLELPDELVELVCKNPGQKLQIKSSEPSGSAPAHAVLCTPTRTFQIRQNETSNTVFLTQPSLSAADDRDIPSDAITAISTVSSTLELTPAESNRAVPLLLRQVPPWPGSYLLEERKLEPHQNEDEAKSKLVSSMPLSDAESAAGFHELCIFCFDGQLYRPTAKQLYQAWQDILNACLAEGIDLGQGALVNPDYISNALEDWPEELVERVLAQLGADQVEIEAAVKFVGAVVLEAETLGGRSIATEVFLERWRNAVPEKWRACVGLELLQGKQQIVAHNILATFYRDLDTSSADANGAGANAQKRKWHEKFKASRKR